MCSWAPLGTSGGLLGVSGGSFGELLGPLGGLLQPPGSDFHIEDHKATKVICTTSLISDHRPLESLNCDIHVHNSLDEQK